MSVIEPEREAVVETLRRLSKRSLLDRILRRAIAGLGLLLLVGVLLRIAGASLRAQGIALGLLGLGVVVALVWSFIRRDSLGRIAGLADSRLDLKDEIKTAYHFILADRFSPWIDLQIHRAAATLGRLDPKEVVPIVLPRRLLVADGLLLAVGMVLAVSSGIGPRDASGTESLTDIERQMGRIEDLLGTEASVVETGTEEEKEEKVAAVEKLDDTIRRLERGEIGLDEGLQEIQTTENMLTEAGLQLAGTQEELEDLASRLEGEGPLGDLAEALKNQKLMEAAELLRALAEKALAGESVEDVEELAERLENAETRSAQLEEWMEALKQAAEALQSGDPGKAEQFMKAAADELESADAEMKARFQMNQAGADLEKLREALAKDARFRRVRGEQDAQRTVQSLDPLDEEARALAEALAKLEIPESEDLLDGNPDGLPMGPVVKESGAPPETVPLDVQLEREMLEAEEKEEAVPEETTQKASREEASELAYESVNARSQYSGADVMSAEVIPWPYRDIVKRYFETLHWKTKP